MPAALKGKPFLVYKKYTKNGKLKYNRSIKVSSPGDYSFSHAGLRTSMLTLKLRGNGESDVMMLLSSMHPVAAF